MTRLLLCSLSLTLLCALSVEARAPPAGGFYRRRGSAPGQPADDAGDGAAAAATAPTAPAHDPFVLELRMPEVHPQQEDAYICTSMKVPEGDNYIVNFTPEASVDRAHHMLLYGCQQPYKETGSWECGPNQGELCKIMFAWAKAAPPPQIPQGVGFEIGENTGVKWLVLQIHYKNPILPSLPGDKSGVNLTITAAPQKYIAGIYILMSLYANIPAHQPKVHSDITCEFMGHAEIHPFAFRPHAHDLGRVITGYMFNDTWYELGKGNPQWPQAFYPMSAGASSGAFTIKPGDYVAARCTYDASDRDRNTKIGGTHNDEMCNFYMMYFTERRAGGDSYYSCAGNNFPDMAANFPEDSDVPLPPNPELEELASGHAHKGMDWSRGDKHSLDYGYRGYGSRGGVSGGGGGGSLYNTNRNRGTSYLNPGYQNLLGNAAADYEADYSNPYQYDYTDFYNQVINQRSRNRGRPDDLEQPTNFYGYPSSDAEAAAASGYRGGLERVDQGYRKGALRGKEVDSAEKVSPGEANAAIHSSKAKSKDSHHHGMGGSDPAMPSGSLVLVEDWPNITPDDKLVLGQVAGIDTDSAGNLHVFHRASVVWDENSFSIKNKYVGAAAGPIEDNTVVTFSPDGRVLKQWGNGMFYMPHGLTIDHDDNIWVTDVALHQVMRFPKGSQKPDLVLGQKLEPGFDDVHFCKPADVAVLKSGEFFVADGYCNHRIVKYSKDGKKLSEWGQSTRDVGDDGFPPPFALRIPHSLTVVDALQRLCVADRENGRIQCFDYNGAFVSQMHPAEFRGRLFAVQYSSHNGLLYAVNGPNEYDNSVMVSGFTLHPANGSLLEAWAPSAAGFSQPHDVAVSPGGDCVYVAEIGPNKVWKFHQDLQHLPAGIVTPQSGAGTKTSGTAPHPESVDSGEAGALDDTISAGADDGDFGASLVIGGLLIIPVIIIVSITVFLRLRKSGKLRFLSSNHKYNNRRFNLGSFFNPHKGFDPLKTDPDECDELDHLNSDSEDVEEYSATNSKA